MQLFIYFLSIFALTSLLKIETSAAQEKMKLASDVWCPYNCKSKTDREGFLVDAIKAIFSELKVEVEYTETSWTRSLELVNAGQADLLIGGWDPINMKKLLHTAEHQSENQNCFYVKSNKSWTYTGINSLSGQRLGIVQDYLYNDEVDRYIQKHQKDSTLINSISGNEVVSRNIDKLLKSRIDVLIEDKLAVEYEISSKNILGLKFAGCITPHLPVLVAFSPKSPNGKRYFNHFKKKWPEFSKSQAYSEIKKKYGLN